MVQCILSCQIMQQRTTLDLSDRLMDMSSVDFSKCKAVYEDGSTIYTFKVTSTEKMTSNQLMYALTENA